MQTDIAIKVSLGRIRDVLETIDDCLHVEHYSVAAEIGRSPPRWVPASGRLSLRQR
ncbi:hypothetical protein ACIPSK_26365 [Rhizobium sp. LARHSG275]